METEESQPAAASSKTPSMRLVIRARIIPDNPSPPPPAPRLNRRAFGLVLAVVVVLFAVLAGIMVFTREPAPELAGGEHMESAARAAASVPATHEMTSAIGNDEMVEGASKDDTAPLAQSTDSQPPTKAPIQAAAAPPPSKPSPITEVIPEALQSALQTIHGTVRVAIQVSIDENGLVRSATSHDPGPSRYFERLSLEAAKQWTFTPSTQHERVMLLRFHFTREGATARASQPE